MDHGGNPFEEEEDNIFASFSSAKTKIQVPIEINVNKLSYWVELPPPPNKSLLPSLSSLNPFSKKQGGIRRQILHDVSLSCQPGNFIALMGPSGSGKTTLLNILSRRVKRNISGHLLYNGIPPEKGLKRKIGYVLQHDILIPNLTVRETLTFTALLRLPNTFSSEEKLDRVEEMISLLHLTKCANSMVGDMFMRGISGGEKKRVCIATELLINPSLFLLDEPTSGLDSSTSFSLIRVLKSLARSGRTVVASLHQPSSQMFNRFDTVVLLGDGHMIYNGPPNQVPSYFNNLGYPFPQHYNPADFMLELIVEDDARKKDLIAVYKENHQNDEEEVHTPLNVDHPPIAKFPTTYWQQVKILAHRNWLVQKVEFTKKLQYVQIIIFAAIIGFFWFQLGTTENDIYPKISATWFFLSYFTVHPTLIGLQTMFAEKIMLSKERAAGTYRLSSWYTARAVAEVPLDLLLPSLFLFINYWMIGLPSVASTFFIVWGTLVFISIISRSAGVSIICLEPMLKRAMVFLSLFILTGIATSGFLIPEDKIPDFLVWLPYLFVPRYAFQIFLVALFDIPDITYSKADDSTDGWSSYPVTGSMIVDAYGSGQPVYVVVLLLILIFVVWKTVGYLALRFVGQNKQ